MPAKSAAIRIEFFGHDRTLSRSFDAAWKKADTFSKKLSLVSSRMTTMGSSMMRSVTLPLVALGTVGARESIKFESAFAGVRKTVDATEAELAGLRTGIREMAKELPSSREEIAGVAESAGQLGIQTRNILGFTRVMIDLGEATNLTADEAATSFARFANIVRMPQSEFDRLGSSVVALGNNMATTEAEIVEMAMRIAGAGDQVGLTEPQIMALAAALSSVGIEAEAGGTAISKTMIGIEAAVQKGGKQLELWAETAGMGAREFAAAWQKDPADALNSVIIGLAKMEQQGGSTLGQLEELGITEVRQRDALLRAAGAGDLLSEALGISGKAWQENSALSKEAAQRYKTTASQLEILKNRATDVAMGLGDALAPSLTKAVDWAGELTEAFDGLSASTKGYIVQAGMVAAAAGPVMWTLGKLGGGLAVAIPLVGRLTSSFVALHAALRVGGVAAFGSTLMASLGPIGLVTAGIAAAGGLVYALHKLDQAMDDSIASTEDFKRVTEALASEGADDLQRWMDKKLGGHYVVEEGELVWKPKTSVDDGGLKDAVVAGVKAAGVAERKAMQEEALLTRIAIAKIAADRAAAIMEAEAPRRGKGGGQRPSPEFLAAQDDYRRAMRLLDELGAKRDELQARFRPIEVRAEISDLRAGIRESEAELERLQKLPPEKRTAEVLLKEDKLRKGIDRAKDRINSLTSKNWKVLIEAKIEKEQKKLDTMEAALEVLNKKKSTPKVEADKKVLEKAIKDSRERLEKLAKQKTSPKIEVTDEATEKARTIRQGLVTMFALPITQTVRVVKTGQGLPQAYGGSYLVDRATSFIAGEAGREVAAFFPLSDPARSRAIFAQVSSQLGSILSDARAMPVPARTHAAPTPQAVAGGGGGMNVRLDVVFPGSTALVGEAKAVARTLAPYIAQELGLGLRQQARRHS